MGANIVLFGATGYTGRKTAAAMVERGLRPVLAGRDAEKLERLSGELGGLETAVADSADPAGLQRLLEPGDVLVTTVGPFLRYGQGALDAALAAGAHYIDSTGEPAFIRQVYETADAGARAAGRTFLTAFGYDYVPGHTVGAMALEAAGNVAVRIDVGYFVAGGKPFRPSQGTRASMAVAVLEPGLFRRNGRLEEGFGGTRLRSFEVGDASLEAISVPGSEHIWLPDDYPALQEVGVYLGWFGRHSRRMRRAALLTAPLLRIPALRAFLRNRVKPPASQGKGPDDAELARAGSHIVGEAFDAAGRRLARADLVGTDGYTYTARMLAWGAEALATGRAKRAGALGPVGAFGLEAMLEGNREAGLG